METMNVFSKSEVEKQKRKGLEYIEDSGNTAIYVVVNNVPELKAIWVYKQLSDTFWNKYSKHCWSDFVEKNRELAFMVKDRTLSKTLNDLYLTESLDSFDLLSDVNRKKWASYFFEDEIEVWGNKSNWLHFYYSQRTKQLKLTFDYSHDHNPNRDECSCVLYPTLLFSKVKEIFAGMSGTISGTASYLDSDFNRVVTSMGDFAELNVQQVVKNYCEALCTVASIELSV